MQQIYFEVKNNAGIITLNRSKALNALSLEMIAEISERLAFWEKKKSVKQIMSVKRQP